MGCSTATSTLRRAASRSFRLDRSNSVAMAACGVAYVLAVG